MSPEPNRGAIGGLSAPERTALIASLVTLVSTFLAWKTAPVLAVRGISAHGVTQTGQNSWGLLTMLIAVLLLGFLLLRSPTFRRGAMPVKLRVPDPVFYIVAGIAELVSVLLFSTHFPGGTVKYGYVLALIGAVVTGFAGFLGLRADAVARRP